MEKAKRRFFTEDYKRQTVELVRSSGRSIGSVATEIGLAETVLRKWVNKFGVSGQPAAVARRPLTQAALPTADQASEIAQLKRENERLRMERDILKKSIAIFAGTRT
jgi:transposase